MTDTTNTTAASGAASHPFAWASDGGSITFDEHTAKQRGYRPLVFADDLPSAPAAQEAEPYPHEQMDALALARYRVVPRESIFGHHAVVAGDGTAQIFAGREVECANMARKFAGAFLDGAFAFHELTRTARHAAAAQEAEPAGIRLLSDRDIQDAYQEACRRTDATLGIPPESSATGRNVRPEHLLHIGRAFEEATFRKLRPWLDAAAPRPQADAGAAFGQLPADVTPADAVRHAKRFGAREVPAYGNKDNPLLLYPADLARLLAAAPQAPAAPTTAAPAQEAEDAAKWRNQHDRDSKELRSLCAARDEARRARDLLKVEIAGLESSCATLGRLVDELRPGHERYAYLRTRDLETVSSGGVFAGLTPDNVVINGDDLDAAIDAARARQEGGAA